MVLEEVGTAATLLVIQPEIGAIIVEFFLIALGVYALFATHARNYPHLANFKIAALIAVLLTMFVFVPMEAIEHSQLWLVPVIHAMLIFLLYVTHGAGALLSGILEKFAGKEDKENSGEIYLLSLLRGETRQENLREVVKEAAATIIAAYVLMLFLLYGVYIPTNSLALQNPQNVIFVVLLGATVITAAYVVPRWQNHTYTGLWEMFLDGAKLFIVSIIGLAIVTGIVILSWQILTNAMINVSKLANTPPPFAGTVGTDPPRICIINTAEHPYAILQITVKTPEFNGIPLLKQPIILSPTDVNCFTIYDLNIPSPKDVRIVITYASHSAQKDVTVRPYPYKEQKAATKGE